MNEMATVVFAATITCPECGFAKVKTMPTDAGEREQEPEDVGDPRPAVRAQNLSPPQPNGESTRSPAPSS